MVDEVIIRNVAEQVLRIGRWAYARWRHRDFSTRQNFRDRPAETMDFETIDRILNESLVTSIRELSLIDRFLTEEGVNDSRFNALGGIRWVIDPLDGTSNFASGEPDWGISVAYEDEGDVHYAIIMTPARGEFFLAEGKTTYFLSLPPDCIGIRKNFSAAQVFETFSSPFRLPQRSLLPPLQRSRIYIHPGRRRNFELSSDNPINRLYAAVGNPACSFSCATALVKVAAGKLDGAVVGFQNYWDFAAGRLILKNAGCHFAAFACGEDLNAFWTGNPLSHRDFSRAVAKDAEGKEWQCHIIAAGTKEVFDDLRLFMRGGAI
jgi:fructose-1,6-bisphosphatase/inositol monophosphatase family enzyme